MGRMTYDGLAGSLISYTSAFLRKALSTKVRVQMLIFRNNSDI